MEEQVLGRIKGQLEEMFSAERKVADYILENPRKVIEYNVTDLAEQSGASDATVIRLCKRVGYKGFYQMKIALAEELGRNQKVGYSDPTKNPKKPKEVIQCLTRDLLRIADMLDDEKVNRCVELICDSKRVYVTAVGNSIPVAMDFAFRLCRLGVDATCGVVVEHGLAGMAKADQDDMLIAISHSGSSRQVIQAVELANSKSLKTLAITSSSNNPLARNSQYYLLTTVENPLFGDNGAASHIYDQAVLDAILYFVAIRQKQISDSLEQIESILAEYKI